MLLWVNMRKILLIAFIFINIFLIQNVLANEVLVDYQGTFKAKVLNIISEREENIGLSDDTKTVYKTLEIKVLDGKNKDKILQIESDLPGLKKNQKIYVNHNIHGGNDYYNVTNIDRVNQLIFFIILFILVIIIFSGYQGVRSVLSLIFSFVVIIYVLMPMILRGYNPIFTSSIIASLILFFAIFFTHGFNKESSVAYGGTMISVLLTSILAVIAVKVNHLSGFTGDESTYLNMNTSGVLDFSGLLLAGIIVGVLGVLDDIAITQAAIVTEIYSTDKNLPRMVVYKKAMRIGREHVSALVNTLILAYVGTSLPLMLLIKSYDYNINTVLNMEIISTEIIRAIIGSIGLILTVPIVTLLAVFYLKDFKHTGKGGHNHHHHGYSHGH